MKKKKMNKYRLSVVVVIIAAIAALSCAMPAVIAADREPVFGCPSLSTVSPVSLTPKSASVEYTQEIKGVGYEQINTQTGTGGYFAGIGTNIDTRGSGSVDTSRTMVADTTGQSSLAQQYSYTYFPVNSPLGSFDRLLSGKTEVKSYPTGTVVRDRYNYAYNRVGTSDFTGDNAQADYSADAQTFGQTNYQTRVVDTENHHHTVMRTSEQHIGNFTTSRSVRTVVTPRTINP